MEDKQADRIKLSADGDSSEADTQGLTVRTSVEAPADEAGKLIAGKYKIIEKLGQGGMGTVYKVEQVLLAKICALKMISSNVSGIHLRRFQVEAKAAAQLEHPNTIKTLDFGLTDEGVAYIVMDYADGIPLSEHVKKYGPLNLDDALKIFIPLAHALDEAHSKGIVHRDIKPSNIMLVKKDRELQGKLADFGIARLMVSDEANALTRTGEIIGSPLYMSPEQCGAQPVDSKSDIYSFGCTLFECLTGTPPFSGASMLETMSSHMSAKPPTLQQASMIKEFPQDLEGLVATLLAKNKADRPQSMFEVAAQLSAIEQGKPLQTPAFQRSAKSAAPTNRQLLLGVAAAVILVAISLPIILFVADGQKQPASTQSSTPPPVVTDKPSEPEPFYPSQSPVTFYSRGTSDSPVRTFDFGPRPIGTLISTTDREGKHRTAVNTVTIAVPLRFYPMPETVESNGISFGRFRADELMSIDFPELAEITTQATVPIGKYKRLKQFNAHGAEMKNYAMPPLRGLPLETLDVRHTGVTGAGLALVGEMKTLDNLRTAELKDPGPALKWLQHSPNLDRLELQSCHELTDDHLKEIATFSKLKMLDISGCYKVTDAGLAHLKQLKNLSILKLQLTRISPNAYAILSKFPSLNDLTLDKDTFANAKDKLRLQSALPAKCLVTFSGATPYTIRLDPEKDTIPDGIAP